jgi:hypothetical protein
MGRNQKRILLPFGRGVKKGVPDSKAVILKNSVSRFDSLAEGTQLQKSLNSISKEAKKVIVHSLRFSSASSIKLFLNSIKNSGHLDSFLSSIHEPKKLSELLNTFDDPTKLGKFVNRIIVPSRFGMLLGVISPARLGFLINSKEAFGLLFALDHEEFTLSEMPGYIKYLEYNLTRK